MYQYGYLSREDSNPDPPTLLWRLVQAGCVGNLYPNRHTSRDLSHFGILRGAGRVMNLRWRSRRLPRPNPPVTAVVYVA